MLGWGWFSPKCLSWLRLLGAECIDHGPNIVCLIPHFFDVAISPCQVNNITCRQDCDFHGKFFLRLILRVIEGSNMFSTHRRASAITLCLIWLSDQAWRYIVSQPACVLQVCQDIVNPGFSDPWQASKDFTLDNAKYRVFGVSLMTGEAWIWFPGIEGVWVGFPMLDLRDLGGECVNMKPFSVGEGFRGWWVVYSRRSLVARGFWTWFPWVPAL